MGLVVARKDQGRDVAIRVAGEQGLAVGRECHGHGQESFALGRVALPPGAQRLRRHRRIGFCVLLCLWPYGFFLAWLGWPAREHQTADRERQSKQTNHEPHLEHTDLERTHDSLRKGFRRLRTAELPDRKRDRLPGGLQDERRGDGRMGSRRDHRR
jgi:hypothetical protein